jgi:hypothetical protein
MEAMTPSGHASRRPIGFLVVNFQPEPAGRESVQRNLEAVRACRNSLVCSCTNRSGRATHTQYAPQGDDLWIACW